MHCCCPHEDGSNITHTEVQLLMKCTRHLQATMWTFGAGSQEEFVFDISCMTWQIIKIRSRLLTPTVGVDNRHRVAIAPTTSSFASLASQPLPQEGGAGLYV